MKRLFTCQDCGEIYSYEDLLQDRTILTEGCSCNKADNEE